MSDFRLAILGEQKPASHLTALKENLHYALIWLDGIWQLDKPANANYILAQISSDKAAETLQTLLKRFPSNRLIVATSTPFPLSGIKWHLPFDEQLPCPSIISLVNILATIYEQEYQLSGYPDSYRAFEYLLGIIRFSQDDNIARSCALNDDPAVIISPQENVYYIKVGFEKIIPLLSVKKSEVTVKKLSDNELAKDIDSIEFGSRLNAYANLDDEVHLLDMGVNDIVKRPLNELVWFSVLVSSKGNPLQSYNSRAKLFTSENSFEYLNDFFKKEYAPLIHLFSQKPMTIIESTKLSRRSIFDTINFCNACTVLGSMTFSD